MSAFAALSSVVFAAEDEFHAHHWFLPETKEIVIGGSAFLILLIPLIKFGLPAAKKMAADRTARIAGQLDDAVTARVTAEAQAQAITADLTDIATERARIVGEARTQAATLKTDLLARVDADIVESRQRAVADMEAAKVRAVAEIQADIARLSFGAAEHVVSSSLDAATQQALIEDFIARVGATKVGV